MGNFKMIGTTGAEGRLGWTGIFFYSLEGKATESKARQREKNIGMLFAFVGKKTVAKAQLDLNLASAVQGNKIIKC